MPESRSEVVYLSSRSNDGYNAAGLRLVNPAATQRSRVLYVCGLPLPAVTEYDLLS
jgi:hypothetical protein